jgi:hypothetical protein
VIKLINKELTDFVRTFNQVGFIAKKNGLPDDQIELAQETFLCTYISLILKSVDIPIEKKKELLDRVKVSLK